MDLDTQHKIVLCLFVAYIWYQLRSRRSADHQLVERYEGIIIGIALIQITIEGVAEGIQDGITKLRAFNRYFNLFPRPTQE